jgi:hypothetical protein
MKRIKEILARPWFILTVYITVALIALVVKMQVDTLNNFRIFRSSFLHLIHLGKLYGEFPADHFDLFLYGPTFSVLVAPFAILPFYPGVVAWVLFCTMFYFYAVYKLPLSTEKRNFILWFSLIELLTTLQNVQANSITASLILFTFIFLDRDKPFIAALFVAIAAVTKVYGMIALALFLLYPRTIRSGFYFLFWVIVLSALPLLFVSFDTLVQLYRDWFATLSMKHNMHNGTSMIGLLRNFDPEFPKYPVQITGIILFCTAFIRYKKFGEKWFRLLMLASCMIWVIIFNHASESNTYIIAVTGTCAWFVIQEKNFWKNALMIFCFIFTVLSPTDIFPPYIKHHFFQEYSLKALPCVVIWFILLTQMLSASKENFSTN